MDEFIDFSDQSRRGRFATTYATVQKEKRNLYPTESESKSNSTWLYRLDERRIQIRTFEAGDGAIISSLYSETLSPNRNNEKYLWLYDIYNSKARRLKFELKGEYTDLQISSSCNKDGFTFFVLTEEERFHMAGIDSHPFQAGVTVLIGTKAGIVEIYQLSGQELEYLSKIASPGPVSYLEYAIDYQGGPSCMIVGHGDRDTKKYLIVDKSSEIPLISTYSIDENFSAQLNENVDWSLEYEDGELVIAKLVQSTLSINLDDEGYNIYTVYHSENGYTLDIYSSEANEILSRSYIPETNGEILDINISSVGGHFLLPEFLEWFGRDLSFESGPYRPAKSAEIMQNREKLGGELFFDKLLYTCDIPQAWYPPRDANQLETLFNAIFYMLKNVSEAKAEAYVKYYGLAKSFVYGVNGFWDFDNGKFQVDCLNTQDAIKFLSDPSVDLSDNPEKPCNWIEKIITNLYRQERFKLALDFIQASSISLWSDDIIDAVHQIYCKVDILGALEFQKAYSVDISISMPAILDQVFNEHSPVLMDQLVKAPLLPLEESCLIDYCSKSNRVQPKKFLLVFFIQRGRYTEAVEAYKKIFLDIPSPIEDEQIDNMIKNVELALPPLQRTIVSQTFRKPLVMGRTSKPEPISAVVSNKQDSTVLLKVLQENYIIQHESVPVNDNEEMDVDEVSEDTFKTPLKIPNSAASSVKEKTPVIIPKSPASPFMQPPVTQRSDITSHQLPNKRQSLDPIESQKLNNAPSPISRTPLIQTPTIASAVLPSSIRSDKSTLNSSYSAALELSDTQQSVESSLSRSPIIQSTPTSSAQKSSNQNHLKSATPKSPAAPPLVNRSPFAASVSRPSPVIRESPRSLPKEIIAEIKVPIPVDSPAKPVARKTPRQPRRRQPTNESNTSEEDRPRLRSTPARKAKEASLEVETPLRKRVGKKIAEEESKKTPARGRKTPAKKETPRPTRTIVTRSSRAENQA
ncbi:Protein ELYS [Boothiomyces macroporosus]|uniref:Protein ELYS n=1 Tax=Boothiomyces macroporosus TaxID=261099 RepID=A0AAD5UQR2_9FUNG|nr:Protein ELYS [Boothiomyces macroporosus]